MLAGNPSLCGPSAGYPQFGGCARSVQPAKQVRCRAAAIYGILGAIHVSSVVRHRLWGPHRHRAGLGSAHRRHPRTPRGYWTGADLYIYGSRWRPTGGRGVYRFGHQQPLDRPARRGSHGARDKALVLPGSQQIVQQAEGVRNSS